METHRQLVPCDIETVWPQIEHRMVPWLEQEPGGVADLLQQVRDGRALCWRSYDTVFILALVPSPGGVDLFIRAAASIQPTTDSAMRHMDALRDIAYELGANKIRFRSPRAGW